MPAKNGFLSDYRVGVVGAGALGSLLAGCLAGAGNMVVAIDVDESRLTAIRAEGIRWRQDGADQHANVAAMRSDQICDALDLIVFVTKAHALPAATASVAHLATDATIAVSMANGLGHEATLAAQLPAATAVLAVTDLSADMLDGLVETHGGGAIRVGPAAPAGLEAAARVATLFRNAGIATTIEVDPRVAIWEKAAFNAALNAAAALTGTAVGALADDAGRRVVHAVAGETVAVARALGIPACLDSVTTRIERALVMQAAHRPSMLQDRDAGRRTEVEAINGAIAAAADRIGVAVPVTATLADLMRVVDRANAR